MMCLSSKQFSLKSNRASIEKVGPSNMAMSMLRLLGTKSVCVCVWSRWLPLAHITYLCLTQIHGTFVL